MLFAERLRAVHATFAIIVMMTLTAGIGTSRAQEVLNQSTTQALPQVQAAQQPGTALERTLTDVTTLLNQITAELDRLDRGVERARNSDGELSTFREAAEDILAQAGRLEKQLAPERNDVDAQIRRLGAKPEEGAPAESDVLTTERERLYALRKTVDSTMATATVQKERARQLVGLIQEYRRTSFRNRLFERSQSPLSPSVWRDVISDASARAKQFGFILRIWWKSIRTDVTLAFALGALGIGILMLRRFARRLISQYRDRGYVLRLDFQGRIASAFVVFLARAIPPITIAGAIFLAISWFSDLPDSFARFAAAIFWAFAIFAVVRALTWTLLATEHTEWRLIPLADDAAISIRKLLVAITGVYAAGLVLHEFIELIFAPPALKIVLNSIACLALAGLVIGLVRTRFSTDVEEAQPAMMMTPIGLKVPLLLSAVAIVVATLSGYIDLALFLSSQVVVTGSIIAIAVFCSAAVGEFSKEVVSERLLPNQRLPGEMTMDDTARRRSSVVIRWLLNMVIAAVAAVSVLLQWGFDWGDLFVWLRQAFFGFEVGAIRISLAAILVGIGLFVAGIFLTRLLQRSLTKTLLSPNRMDHGLSNSIRTGVGYAGFALSTLVAVSYAGFNFTNLAIVAGALSVGIGFGLQSIVNNFVSGLILLAERPIQVGDWIVVGDKEGYVRRISVRATVIETFDRASLIIPNSDLMTAAVTNWTYGNRLGRVVVRVGTAYDTDPQFVYETLLDIGRNCTLALTNPPPSVVFEDFADSTLNFSLRIYIADINNIVRAQTELRMDIWKVFREKSIDIDFPQLDVHIKRD